MFTDIWQCHAVRHTRLAGIGGQVLDPAGTPVPDAAITLTNVATHSTSLSDASGNYTLMGLMRPESPLPGRALNPTTTLSCFKPGKILLPTSTCRFRRCGTVVGQRRLAARHYAGALPKRRVPVGRDVAGLRSRSDGHARPGCRRGAGDRAGSGRARQPATAIPAPPNTRSPSTASIRAGAATVVTRAVLRWGSRSTAFRLSIPQRASGNPPRFPRCRSFRTRS